MILQSVDKSNYSPRHYAADEHFILLTIRLNTTKFVFLLPEFASIALSRVTPFLHDFFAMTPDPLLRTIIIFENLGKKLIGTHVTYNTKFKEKVPEKRRSQIIFAPSFTQVPRHDFESIKRSQPSCRISISATASRTRAPCRRLDPAVNPPSAPRS